MSINPLSPQERLRAAQAVAALRANTAPAPSTTPSVRKPDDVSISEEARALAASRENGEVQSPEREERLAALKAAIADGTYNVSARDLARSMLKSGDLSI